MPGSQNTSGRVWPWFEGRLAEPLLAPREEPLFPVRPRWVPERIWNNRERIGRIAYWSAVGLVMAAFFLACFHAIGNYWAWGHNGYNGAAFSQAARNSLRFGILGQAQYYTGLEPPVTQILYTHHPMLLHFHLIGSYWLFGETEWAARLIPALYSFLTLPMLFILVRRYFGKAMALASITVYALIPLNLIFANMVDHEQGSIFWCLFFMFMYLRWAETGKWRFFGLVMLGITMALQFDWPGYYLAFFVVVHAALTGVRHHQRLFQWRREYTFCIVFSAIVLLNFYLFYRFIISVHGGFADMMGAYDMRSAPQSGYFKLLWTRSADLHGRWLIVLMAVWLPWFVIRLARAKAHLGDLVPLFFFLAQVVHSLVFKQAGSLHAYWVYHLSPAIAVGVAGLMVGTARAIPYVLREFARVISRVLVPEYRRRAMLGARRAGAAISAVVIAVPLVHQVRFAWDRMQWGFDTGTASYVEPYDDQFLQVMWIQSVTERYNRSNTDFLLHPSVAWRIEWMWYLDAPYQTTTRTRLTPAERSKPRHQVMLFDLHRFGDVKTLGTLVRQNHSMLYARRFLAVVASEPGGSFEAYAPEREERPFGWSWFVNPNHAPIRWAPERDLEAARGVFASDVEITATEHQGGQGGGASSWDCGRGLALIGFDTAFSTTTRGGRVMYGLTPRCRPIPGVPGRADAQAETTVGPTFGQVQRSRSTRAECPADQVVVGIHGRAGSLVDAFGIVCATPVYSAAGEPFRFETKGSHRLPSTGTENGSPFETLCPAGTVGWGFRGRSGVLIDGVALSCAKVDERFAGLEAPATSVAPRVQSPVRGPLRTLAPNPARPALP